MTSTKKGRTFGIAAIGLAAVIGSAIIVNQVAGIGLRMNLSHSAPVGVWRVSQFHAATLARGELVEVCPPAAPIVQMMADRGYIERGNCEGTRVAPLLKTIGAVPGDLVVVQHGRTVAVNGKSIPNTTAIAALPAWPDGTYAVSPGHVWLFSTYTPASFDSRYFGPVELASIRGKATPVMVHGEAADMARVNGGAAIMIGIELLLACAPNVAAETTQQIIQIESRGDPLAINVNKGRLERKPRDAADAAALAKKYIAAGYSVDLGLMQVNSRNLGRLGYRVEDMFEPCKNIAAGARVLSAFYANARPKYGSEQAALRAALSAYNTGDFNNGFTNGYVAKYGGGSPVALAQVPALNPYTAASAVFIRQLKEEKAAMTNIENKQAAPQQPEHVAAVVSRSTDDADVPGVQVEYTADDAERNGAFVETAMSEREAWESNAMLDPNATAIVVGGKSVAAGNGQNKADSTKADAEGN